MNLNLCALILLLHPAAQALPGMHPSGEDSVRTVRVIPGPEFAASALPRFTVGTLWREAWTSEIGTELLDVSGLDGNPRIERQIHDTTLTLLRMRGENGVVYTFRPLRQHPAEIFPPDVLSGYAQNLLEELVAGTYPYAASIAEVLCDAAGVPTDQSRLVVLPQDEQGDAFGLRGRPGMLTRRSDVTADTVAHSTPFVLSLAASTPAERIDAVALLKLRLMDFLMGSWHDGSADWNWTSVERGGTRFWSPAASRHPLAFCKFDGVLSAAGSLVASMPGCDAVYPDVKDLAWNGRLLDRIVLSSLSGRTYDSLAQFIVQQITDSVVIRAIGSIPVERRNVDGPVLLETIQQRRRHLPELAQRYYRWLAVTVDIKATAAAEWCEIERVDASRLTVHLYARKDDGARDSARCLFSRNISADETDEIRLYTGGGGDYIHLRGTSANSVLVRIITEGGDDTVVDSSRTAGPPSRWQWLARGRSGKSLVYDDLDSLGAALQGVRLERITRNPQDGIFLQKPNAPEDRGSSWEMGVMLDLNSAFGPLLGIGPVYYRYGFRAVPYAWMFSAIGGYAPLGGTGRVRVSFDSRTLIPGASIGLSALLSGYEMSGYYGLGNEAEELESKGSEFYRPELRQYRLGSSLRIHFSSAWRLTLAGSANYVRTEERTDRYASQVRPYGVDGLAFFGIGGSLQYDTRDEPANPQEGMMCRVGGMLYPHSRGLAGSFGKSECDVRAFVGGTGASALTLALRAQAQKVWGDVPFYERANLGGWDGLRGLSSGRYLGDALALGAVELRASLGHLQFLIPSTVGLAIFGEAGRVFVAGESSRIWHASYGGTLWIAPWSRGNTMSLIFAGSKEGMEMYFDVGMGF